MQNDLFVYKGTNFTMLFPFTAVKTHVKEQTELITQPNYNPVKKNKIMEETP